ncbi:Uncharacterized protein Adt_39480 [Abeliophyllum distichum]|uniref:Uncharacterized protein n=1 Tax=Abeliophyllum distichum TaxID=126358 RepID=A0ABD1Q648_9LAMI
MQIDQMAVAMSSRPQGLDEAKPAKFTRQLANRSIKKLFEMVEDVVMRVENLLFSIDFVVLDMLKDAEIPIILGQPFLATFDALIDVSQGVLTLRVQHEIEVKDNGKQMVWLQEADMDEHVVEVNENITDGQIVVVKWKMKDKPQNMEKKIKKLLESDNFDNIEIPSSST